MTDETTVTVTDSPTQPLPPIVPPPTADMTITPEEEAAAARYGVNLGEEAPPKAPAAAPTEPAAPAKPAAEGKEPPKITAADIERIQQDIVNSGALSDETRRSLNGKGATNEALDLAVSHIQLRIQSLAPEIEKVFGSRDGFDAASKWLNENLPATQADAFGRWLLSPDPAERTNAANAMKALYANGNPESALLFPKLQPLSAASSPKSEAFQSDEEMEIAFAEHLQRASTSLNTGSKTSSLNSFLKKARAAR